MSALVKVSMPLLRSRPEPGGGISSIDLSTDEGKRLMHRAFVGSDGIAKRELGKSLSLVHFVCHETMRPDDDTGEMKVGIRCVYLTSDGRRISSSSYPLWDSLCTMCNIFGFKAPFDPPLVVVVRSAPTQKAGQDYLYFDLP
jgi:hypothetical protein